MAFEFEGPLDLYVKNYSSKLASNESEADSE
jgi:hypothetical protein